MGIHIWRIIKAKYAESAFDGEGARLFGGRWNEPGTPMIYTSESLSLAALELLVHLDRATPKFKLVSIQAMIPKNVAIKSLKHLKATENNLKTMQILGTKWAKSLETAVLQVPSIIIPQESNFLLNPKHPEFKKIKISTAQPFEIDERLINLHQ